MGLRDIGNATLGELMSKLDIAEPLGPHDTFFCGRTNSVTYSSLANYSFRFVQKVCCYWKTTDKKDKAYFEGEVIEMWDNSKIVEENLPNEVDEPDEIVEC